MTILKDGSNLGRRGTYSTIVVSGILSSGGSKEISVFGIMTKSDMCAMLDTTNDWIYNAGYDYHEWLIKNGEPGKLYYVPTVFGNLTPEDIKEYPETHIRFPNAAAKKDHQAQARIAKVTEREEREKHHKERLEALQQKKLDAVARTLYDFELRNEPWDMVSDTTRDLFMTRATEVIKIVKGKP